MKNSENFETKMSVLIERFPLFLPTIKKLNHDKIPWMISGSACLFLLGNNRLPGDIDFFLPDESHDQVDRQFGCTSFTFKSVFERARNSHPEDDHSIQFTSDVVLTLGGREYPYRVTPDLMERRIKKAYCSEDVWIQGPEDIILSKALMQRSVSHGKHDIEDIRNFAKIYPLDRNYIRQRVQELHATERVGTIFDTLP